MEEAMELKILNMRKALNTPIVKAFVDIDFYGMIIKSLRIVSGRNGVFVSYPREKGKDGKFYDIIYPDNTTLKAEIESFILSEYTERLQDV